MRQIGREVLCCKHAGCPTVEVRAEGVVLEDDYGGCLVLTDNEAIAAADLISEEDGTVIRDGVLMVRDANNDVHLFRLEDGIKMTSEEGLKFGEVLDSMLDRGPNHPVNLKDA